MRRSRGAWLCPTHGSETRAGRCACHCRKRPLSHGGGTVRGGPAAPRSAAAGALVSVSRRLAVPRLADTRQLVARVPSSRLRRAGCARLSSVLKPAFRSTGDFARSDEDASSGTRVTGVCSACSASHGSLQRAQELAVAQCGDSLALSQVARESRARTPAGFGLGSTRVSPTRFESVLYV